MPSAPTAIQESSLPGSMCDVCVPNGPWAWASGSSEAALKLTMSAPEVFRSTQAFQGHNLGAADHAHGRDAGTNCATVHEDCAGSALAKRATEFRPAQLELVAEHVQQWGHRIDINDVGTAVDL